VDWSSECVPWLALAPRPDSCWARHGVCALAPARMRRWWAGVDLTRRQAGQDAAARWCALDRLVPARNHDTACIPADTAARGTRQTHGILRTVVALSPTSCRHLGPRHGPVPDERSPLAATIRSAKWPGRDGLPCTGGSLLLPLRLLRCAHRAGDQRLCHAPRAVRHRYRGVSCCVRAALQRTCCGVFGRARPSPAPRTRLLLRRWAGPTPRNQCRAVPSAPPVCTRAQTRAITHPPTHPTACPDHPNHSPTRGPTHPPAHLVAARRGKRSWGCPKIERALQRS
jgi:hypothetical protein